MVRQSGSYEIKESSPSALYISLLLPIIEIVCDRQYCPYRGGVSMNTKRCFFIGHRDTPEDILYALRMAIEGHIVRYGVEEFVVGDYGSFDRYARMALLEAKERYPRIALIQLAPYQRTGRSVKLWDGFHGIFCPPIPPDTPKRLYIVKANQYMVEHCDYLIACTWKPGNSRRIVEYAAKKRMCGVDNLGYDL